MPAHHRVGLDEHQRLGPVAPDVRQDDPKQSVGCVTKVIPRSSEAWRRKWDSCFLAFSAYGGFHRVVSQPSRESWAKVGGEGGIRTRQDLLDSVSYRFYVARIAVDASLAVAPCTTLHRWRLAAAEPDVLVKELAGDEAIEVADTLLVTIPNQLGVDDNAHMLESILKYVAPELGWR